MAPPPRKKPPPPCIPGQKFPIVTLDQTFDADFVMKYSTCAKPVDYQEDPILLDMLIKSATLAIRDYNTQHHTDYRFVEIEMATFVMASGPIFHVTFKCMNAEIQNQYTSFQASVWRTKRTRKVLRIRIKESSTWCTGGLCEPV
ncbi:hypothetical protein P8452_72643 [Trifolium repens]|nr:hypothetical protein P8452_72643 [Trifolium repens]